MKIKIQTIHFKFRQQLRDLIEKKLEKLRRLCGDVIHIDVKLTLERAASNANKLCGIRLAIRGNDLLSNTRCESFEEAIAKAVEALERQIEKRKTKTLRRAIANPSFYFN